MSNSIEPVQQSQIQQIVEYPLDQNPAASYIGSLPSAHSRRTMANALNQVADLLTPHAAPRGEGLSESDKRRYLQIDWAALRFQHLGLIRTRLIELYAPATVNKIQAALRGVIEAAHDLEQMDDANYRRARKVLKTVKNETLPAGREITGGEMQALVQVCKADTTPAGARDAAIIAVLYAGGLRRSELVALDVADMDASTGKLNVIAGKGRKDRTAYLQGGALRALQAWLNVRGAATGALFQPINKGGAITPRRMTDQAVYAMLEKRAKQAGVSDFSPHDMRRTFVSELLDRGADIVTVQKLAGHNSPLTTSRYDRRPEEAKREASKLLHFPF